jgi:hypothetical protein
LRSLPSGYGDGTDQLTHTIWGEHTTAVFFLFFMTLPFVPVFAPGLVLMAASFAESVGIVLH